MSSGQSGYKELMTRSSVVNFAVYLPITNSYPYKKATRAGNDPDTTEVGDDSPASGDTAKYVVESKNWYFSWKYLAEKCVEMSLR